MTLQCSRNPAAQAQSQARRMLPISSAISEQKPATLLALQRIDRARHPAGVQPAVPTARSLIGLRPVSDVPARTAGPARAFQSAGFLAGRSASGPPGAPEQAGWPGDPLSRLQAESALKHSQLLQHPLSSGLSRLTECSYTARTLDWRSGTVLLLVMRKSKLFSISAAISRQDSMRVQPAASWIASGLPSASWQMRMTAAGSCSPA